MKKNLLSAMFVLAALSLQAQTIYVTTAGTGNGASWATASGLEKAVSNAPSGAEIWVQTGTYHPSTMLTVPNGVKLYGGFAGGETILSQRDFVNNPTVIDAQQKYGSVVRLDVLAVLDGFIIQNGNAQGNPHRNGGGIWADDSTGFTGQNMFYWSSTEHTATTALLLNLEWNTNAIYPRIAEEKNYGLSLRCVR